MKLRKEKWETVRLGKLSHGIEYGLTACAEDYGDTILLRITDVNENGKLNKGLKYSNVDEKTFIKYQLRPNNVLIARSGATAGKAYIHKTDGRFIFASYMLRIVLKEEFLNPDFFFAFLNSSNYNSQLGGIKVGSAQPNVNTTNLATLNIPLPPLEEQKQIAALFQSIDTAIEQVEGQEKNLKALRKSLINKLTKQDPLFGNLIAKSNCKKYLFGDLAVEVPDRTDNPQNSGFEKFIGLEDFDSGELTIQRFSSTEKLVSAMKLCKQGDVLFARRNAYLKRASLTDFDAVCSGDVIVMRANERIILPKFLILIMNTDEFWEFAISNAAGTMSKRVKWRDLAIYSLELPDLKIQSKILDIFSQLEKTLSQIKQQKTTLQHLKQKLLSEILG